MNNIIKLSFVFTVLIMSFSSCKTDTTQNGLSSEPKNEVEILEKEGISDLSAEYHLKQDQILPAYSNAFYFKSLNSFNIYITGPADKQPTDFEINDVLAYFSDSTIFYTTFKADTVDFNGERPLINLIEVPSEKKVASYRPSFVMAVPKSKINALPILRLNGKALPVTTMQ